MIAVPAAWNGCHLGGLHRCRCSQLARLRGAAHHGLEMLITTLRNVLQMLLPISFNESTDEDRRRRVSAILTPLSMPSQSGTHQHAPRYLFCPS